MNKIMETLNNTIAENPVLLDVQAGLTQAKDTVMSNVKFIVNSIAIPIICAILACVMIFAILGAIRLHKQGEDYSKKIATIVVIVIVIALIASAPTWVWTMVGV